MDSVGILMTDIRHAEFRKYCTKNLVLISNRSTFVGYSSFLTKTYCIYGAFHQGGLHYCTAHKFSTETVVNVSRLINTFAHWYI